MDLIYKFNIQSPRHLTLVSLNEFVFWSVHWKKNLFWEVWYHWTPELLFSSLCLNCAFLFKPENLNYYLYHCAQTVTFFSNLSHVFFGKSGTVEHLNYYSDHCAQTVTFFSNLNHVFFCCSQILHQWLDGGFRPAYILYEQLHNREPIAITADFMKKNGYRFLTKLGWNYIYEHKADDDWSGHSDEGL